MGTARLVLTGEPFGLEQLNAQLWFNPTRDMAIESVRRDLVPFGIDGDILEARGTVEARQRKMNTGLLYFTLERPASASFSISRT